MSFQHQPPRNPIKDLSQPTPVETYLDLLLLAIQASDEPLKFLTESRVTRVWMVKEVKGIHHEYTLVKVCFNSNSETHYFRIERTHGAKSQQTIEELLASNDPELIEIGNDFKGLCAPPSETTSTLSVNSAEPASEMSPMTSTLPVNNAEPASGTSLSVSPVQEPPHVAHPSSLNTPKSLLGKTPHPANDTISFLNSLDPPHPDVTLHDIHPENLTWLQFILIVNLVHSEDRIYSVIGNQCYWFSQLIFLLTRAKFCPAATKEPAPSNDSTVPVHISRRLSCPDLDHQYLKLERSKNGMAPGSWMSVQATRIEIFLLNKLQSMFDFRWHEIRQNIEDWAEKAAKVQSLIKKDLEARVELEKKQPQALSGGPLSSSRSRPHISGRGMSTLPRGLGFRLGRMGSHAGIWTPPSFNSLRAPPPANQKRGLDLVLGFGRIFKRKL